MSVTMGHNDERVDSVLCKRQREDEVVETKRPRLDDLINRDHHDASDSDNDSKAGDDNASGDERDDVKQEKKDEEEVELDPKEMLIVKDGTIKVAQPYKEPEPQYDANGELIKASGTWTQVEHDRFLKALQMYPKGPWKAIAAMVGSRTVRQTQTHAQKYREKMARRLRGLRNRNGTLQTPPMRLSQLVASSPVYGHLVMPSMQYTHRPPSHGGVEYLPMPGAYVASPSQSIDNQHGMRPTLPADIYYPTHPSNGYQHLHVAHQSPHNAHTPNTPGMSIGYDMSFKNLHNQSTPLGQKTPSNDDLTPTAWSENAPKTLGSNVDYNDSMDFLMNVYTIDPNHPAAQQHLQQAQQHHYAQHHGSSSSAATP